MSITPAARTLKMQGKTITSVECNKTKDEIIFEFSDGTAAWMLHRNDCCEVVTLEEIIGDLDDLKGSPLLTAELRTSNNDDNPKDPKSYEGSHTWSFYEFATIKGSVTMRWYGESNGYYSETVDIYYYTSPEKIKEENHGYSPRHNSDVDYGYGE